MNPKLRYEWNRNATRIYDAADPDQGGNAGPCKIVDWAARSGVDRSHCYEAIRDLVSYGAVTSNLPKKPKPGEQPAPWPEEIRIDVQGEEFWDQSLAICSFEKFIQAYAVTSQRRLGLVTEQPSFNEALSEIRTTDRADRERLEAQSSSSRADPERPVVRNPDNLARDQAQKPDVVPNPDNLASPRDRDRDPLIEKYTTSSRDPLEGTLERENSFPRLEDTRPELEPERRDRTWLMAKLHRIPQLEAEVMRPQTQDQQRTRRIFWELEQRCPDVLAGYLGDLADRTDIRNKAAWFNASVTAWLAAHPPARKRESERVGK